MPEPTMIEGYPETVEEIDELSQVTPYIEEEEGVDEAGAVIPRPLPALPIWQVLRGVSGRYEAYGPLVRPVPVPIRVPGRVPIPPGPQPLPTPGPTPAAGETELIEDPEALIPIPFPFARESLFLDVHGLYPQMTASGTLRMGLRTRVHWIARLVRTRGLNTWSGRIWFKDGDVGAFPYTQVDIQVNNSLYPWQRRATVRFSTFGHAPGRTRTFRYRSRAYRTVEFEFDHAEGTRPVLRVDTHAHPNHPATLPAETLTINRVFQRAGFNVRSSGGHGMVPLSLAGADKRWSDMEMHDAMQVYWSRFANASQWSMWVFFAALHERGTGLGGIMFDDIGPNHRQGTAIFTDSFISNPPTGETHPDEWVRRMTFWTACHEMGHAFNLAHSWQKELGTPWIASLHNEAEARSFMNYPYYVTGGQAAFFADFEYRFSDQELLFVRHAPERYVQMGNADWFDHHGLEQAEVPAEPMFRLELRINRQKPLFEFLEPVYAELKLTNVSGEPQLVPRNLLEDFSRICFIIKKQGRPARQLIPYARYCDRATLEVLMPGDGGKAGASIYASNFLSAGLNGWDLSEPGNYMIQAAIRVNGEDVVSNPLQIRVAPPQGYDEDLIAQDFISDDVGRILFFNGSQFLEGGNNTLRETTARLSDRVVARHARLALARAKARRCKLLYCGDSANGISAVYATGGGIRQVEPSVEEARSNFQAALTDDMDVTADTLGHIKLNEQTRCMTDWLAEQDQRDEATAVTDALADVLDKRGVLKTVVNDIKKRGKEYKK